MRSLCLGVLWAWVLLVAAQKVLERPLSFVPGGAVLVVDQTADNLVMQALSVNPYLAPETSLLSDLTPKQQKQLFRRWQRTEQAFLKGKKIFTDSASNQPMQMPEQAFTQQELAYLYLLTGEWRFAQALDSLKQEARSNIAQKHQAQKAAQTLLNSLSWTYATTDSTVIVNAYENSLVNIKTPNVQCSLDVILQGEVVKVRISGLEHSGKKQITLRLRLFDAKEKTVFYHNGRKVLRPIYDNGYFQITRAWRNNEEVFFELPTAHTEP